MVHSSWIAELKVTSEIVCRFRRDRVSISSGALKPRSCVDFAEIVCRFRQVIDWSSLEIGSDLKNLHRGGELWERGDKGIEKVSTEIENQRSEKRRIEQARLCSRSVARSTGGGGRSTAWSTSVHDVHKVSPVDRPIDRGRERSTGPVDQLKAGCSRFGAVDRGMGRSTGRSTDRRVLTFLLGFGFLF